MIQRGVEELRTVAVLIGRTTVRAADAMLCPFLAVRLTECQMCHYKVTACVSRTPAPYELASNTPQALLKVVCTGEVLQLHWGIRCCLLLYGQRGRRQQQHTTLDVPPMTIAASASGATVVISWLFSKLDYNFHCTTFTACLLSLQQAWLGSSHTTTRSYRMALMLWLDG